MPKVTTVIIAGVLACSLPVSAQSIEPVIVFEAPHERCSEAVMALGPNGNSYRACRDYDARTMRIQRLGADGQLLADTLFPADAHSSSPAQIAVSGTSVYVVGRGSRVQEEGDAVVAAFSLEDLRLLWSDWYDGPGHGPDHATSVTVAPEGPVFVSAVSQNDRDADLLTLAYELDGTLLWEARYDSGEDDWGNYGEDSIALDGAGGVYVLGSNRVLRYTADGALAFAIEQPTGAVAVDAEGHAIVTSPANPSGETARIRPDGSVDWHVFQGGHSLALDPAGPIYVTRTIVTSNASEWDWETAKLDARGRVQWTIVMDGGRHASAAAIGLDAEGDAYVTGTSHARAGLLGVTSSYLTIRYAADGSEVWSTTWADNGWPTDMVVTAEGQVFVTGSEGTVSYEQHTLPPAPPPSCPWWAFWCWF